MKICDICLDIDRPDDVTIVRIQFPDIGHQKDPEQHVAEVHVDCMKSILTRHFRKFARKFADLEEEGGAN